MTASEFEILRADLLGLRADVDRHFAEVEAKLLFGIGAVVTSTVIVLKNIGMMG